MSNNPRRTKSTTQPMMPNKDDFRQKLPHITLFPSAGMGHLTPFLRLASMLASRGCTITVITVKPTVSAAEADHMSSFFSNYPHINRLEFEILPYNPSDSTTTDPFFMQWHAISCSVHLLRPLLLSSTQPISAIFSDPTLVVSLGPLVDELCIPNYIVFTSSAKMLSLIASLPLFISENSTKFVVSNGAVEIPGIPLLPLSSIPPPFFNPNHLFTSHLLSNARFFPKAKGLLLNTFEKLETETIHALNNGKVLSCLPPVLAIGPFEPHKLEMGGQYSSWLDNHGVGTVVYVSFGSRTAMSKDQIRELGNGLERSRCAFFWVLKGSKVDKEDNGELQELLGDSFLEGTKNRGMVVKGWVQQDEILAHPAIGGFISHCGWNSVIEAAQHGVPILAWPQHGDQRLNAEVVESAGLGMWESNWGWSGERLVKGEEIGDKVREMMSEEKLRNSARETGEEARKAGEAYGSSEKALVGFIDTLKRERSSSCEQEMDITEE